MLAVSITLAKLVITSISYLNMGLINKVDMVCLSPVGFGVKLTFRALALRRSNLVDQTHIQRTRPRRKTVFFKTSLRVLSYLKSIFSKFISCKSWDSSHKTINFAPSVIVVPKHYRMRLLCILLLMG